MKTPQFPPNEKDRLKALRDLLILDTPPEERFNRITEYAAKEFDVPIALLSMIDENRQWFKARFGLVTCETERRISFCGHAILQNEIMLIPDTSLDERFFDNPLVTNDPYIRFYAGAQLRVPSGEIVGTLCLIDRVTRQLDKIDLAILASLRDLAVDEMIRRSDEANQ
jgi:GAF domain-containing protein